MVNHSDRWFSQAAIRTRPHGMKLCQASDTAAHPDLPRGTHGCQGWSKCGYRILCRAGRLIRSIWPSQKEYGQP